MVGRRAEALAGPSVWVVDEADPEGARLSEPWCAASIALLDAALAFGAPDLLERQDHDILTAAARHHRLRLMVGLAGDSTDACESGKLRLKCADQAQPAMEHDMAKLPHYTLTHNERKDRWDLVNDGTGRTKANFDTKAEATKGGVLEKGLK